MDTLTTTTGTFSPTETPALWEAVAARKRANLEASIRSEWRLDDLHNANPPSLLHLPRTCGKLSTREIAITEDFDATDLVERLQSRRLTSTEVVSAFVKRAAIAHQLANCLTEFFPDEALERAKFLDSYYEKHGEPIGPLHGLPVSVKDTFHIAGKDTSIGLAALAFKPRTETSTLVQLLLSAGAVLYCKTNIPQALVQLDTVNNVFGRTLNPTNIHVTIGGSSGGEAALIALRGSVLGVGTDLGGSVRIPAFCAGLYSIKPSWQRVPFSGQQVMSRKGTSRMSFEASAGPIASTTRDCEMFLRVVSEMKPWEIDHDVVFGDWNSQGSLSAQPIIGIVKSDGLIEPLPPIARLMDEVATKLWMSGVQVVEMDISHVFSKCKALLNGLLGVDDGSYFIKFMEAFQEPFSPWLAARVKERPQMTIEQLRNLQEKRSQLESQFLKIWKTQDGRDIDAFICPTAPHPVAPINRWNGTGYTSAFVLTDYPAGTIPIRNFVEKDMEGEVPNTPPLTKYDELNRQLWTKVDRKIYLESPLGIQIVAPKMQERKLCQAMELIDDILRASRNSVERAKL